MPNIVVTIIYSLHNNKNCLAIFVEIANIFVCYQEFSVEVPNQLSGAIY